MPFPPPPTSTLVLPTGATSGTRIVLDGTSDTITGYNPDNTIAWQLTGGAPINVTSATNATNLTGGGDAFGTTIIAGAFTIGSTFGAHAVMGTDNNGADGIRLYANDGVTPLIDLNISGGTGTISLATSASGQRIVLDSSTDSIQMYAADGTLAQIYASNGSAITLQASGGVSVSSGLTASGSIVASSLSIVGNANFSGTVTPTFGGNYSVGTSGAHWGSAHLDGLNVYNNSATFFAGASIGGNLTANGSNVSFTNSGTVSIGNFSNVSVTNSGLLTLSPTSGVRMTTIGPQAIGGTVVAVTAQTSGTFQIGYNSSSGRYKSDVSPLELAAAAALDELRPVTFLNRNDPHDTHRYVGLIAEDVAQIPGLEWLVIHSPDPLGNFRPEAVDYEKLALPLLLKVRELEHRLARLEPAA